MAEPCTQCLGYKGDTCEVHATFWSDTPKADMWEALVTSDIKGHLQDSRHVMVTQFSKGCAEGNYHFYAPEAGVQPP